MAGPGEPIKYEPLSDRDDPLRLGQEKTPHPLSIRSEQTLEQTREPHAMRRALWPLIVGMVAFLQLPGLISIAWPPKDIVSDFFQDWASGRNWWTGLPVYTDHRVTIPRYIGSVDPYCLRVGFNAHPPSSVLMVIPWALLGYREALLAWNLLSLGMLLASLEIIRRSLELPLTLGLILPAVTFLLLGQPLLMQFFHGQWNLILLLLVTASWTSERSGRPYWAGVLLGTATAIKLFPAFLFLYFLMRRQWIAVIAGAVAFGMLTGLTAGLLGPETYRVYLHDVLPKLGTNRSSWYNASLIGFWTKLLDPATAVQHVVPLWRSGMTLRVAILLTVIAVMATVAWVVRRANTRAALDHAFGLAVTGMLLVSPITWDHSFVLLLFPISILLHDPPPLELARVVLIVSLAAIWFLGQRLVCAWLIPGGLLEGFAYPVHTLTVLAYPCYALVTIFVIQAFRSGSTGLDLQAEQLNV
jgi:Glycosyltransferase family 87